MILERVLSDIEKLNGISLGVNINEYVWKHPLKSNYIGCLHYEDVDGEYLEMKLHFPQVILDWTERVDQNIKVNPKNLMIYEFLIEEISHFAYMAWKCCDQGISLSDVSRTELELQSNIDKYLLIMNFIFESENRIPKTLRKHLFENDDNPNENLPDSWNKMYRRVEDLAHMYSHHLESEFIRTNRFRELMDEVRSFYRMNERRKINHILH